MTNPSRIGYSNFFDDASTIVASNEATDFDKENAYDWLTYDWWKPGATGSQTLTCTFGAGVTPDYFACFAHNLGTEGASIVLQSEIASVWTDAFSDISPTGTEVIFEPFTAAAQTDWRVLITDCTVDTYVGVIAFGSVLELPQGMGIGFSPPNMNRKPKILNNVSMGGATLGRSYHARGERVDIKMDQLDPAWVRANWEPFLDHAELKPFFLSWDDDNYPAEAAYCWTSKDSGKVSYSSAKHMRISLGCDALTK